MLDPEILTLTIGDKVMLAVYAILVPTFILLAILALRRPFGKNPPKRYDLRGEPTSVPEGTEVVRVGVLISDQRTINKFSDKEILMNNAHKLVEILMEEGLIKTELYDPEQEGGKLLTFTVRAIKVSEQKKEE